MCELVTVQLEAICMEELLNPRRSLQRLRWMLPHLCPGVCFLENMFQTPLLLNLPARTEGCSKVQGKKQRKMLKIRFYFMCIQSCENLFKNYPNGLCFLLFAPPVLNSTVLTAFNPFVFILFSRLVKTFLLHLQFRRALAILAALYD